MNKMSFSSRIIIAIASVAWAATYFVPIWFIFLIAPQYPEGLTMNIWLNKITGQVEIINGLNHYIGMKHISADMFPEFTYLVYIVAAFILLGLVVALVGKRKLLFGYLILIVLAGLVAMYDFYQWSYDYGHNLDPKAAIQVPGLSYQPPLIGHKTLLNFDAYSYPDTGAWIVIGSFVVLLFVWFMEWRKSRQTAVSSNKAALPSLKKTAFAAAIVAGLGLSSCSAKPEPITLGKDGCHFCKMTIMSPQFGAEVVTKKGKVFKFDDMHCVVSFLKEGSIKTEDIAQTLAVNYQNGNDFIDATKAAYVQSEQLRSPMGSNAAALANNQAAAELNKTVNGRVTNWQTLYNEIK
jgi:copper chaperone NosL